MNLPQEIIDQIIYNLVPDVSSLRSRSLVTKSWEHTSRKWLFNDVFISGKTYQQWVDRIAPENVEPLRHIRFFTYIPDGRAGGKMHRIDTLHRYLLSLCQLERLGLSSMFLGPDVLQQTGLFSAFQQILSSLGLAGCHTTSSALIAIINYFPLLVSLDLQSVSYEEVGEPVPRLSRPLRGRLVITECSARSRALFDKLSNPSPELDELVLR